MAFVLLFLAAGFFSVLWLMFATTFFIGRRKKSRALSWLGGIPLLISTGGAVVLAALIALSTISTSNPATVYEIYFGARPGADVSAMKSSFYAFGDYQESYLGFGASPATISRITAKGWKRLGPRQIQLEDFASYRSDDAPAWWTPVKTKTSRVYEADKRLGNFSTSESEILVYDEASGQAFYSYFGLD